MVSFGCKSEISFNLPMYFLSAQPQIVPHRQPYTEEENNKFLENLFVIKDEVVSTEKETAKQATCNKRTFLREKQNNIK